VVKRLSARGGGFGEPLPPGGTGPLADAVPEVAWRTVSLPSGGSLMVHQRALKGVLDTSRPGGYGIGCGNGPVESSLAVLKPGAPAVAVQPILRGALPVDLAVNSDGTRIAVALAGSQTIHVMSNEVLTRSDDQECPPFIASPPLFFENRLSDGLGIPTSVAWTPAGALLAYYPELPALVVRSGASLEQTRIVELPGEVGYNPGRGVFHKQTGSGLACASCHPEAREDGQVWEFAETGLRRTQSLAGGILKRGPYHWEADMADLDVLMDDVFTNRMAGGELTKSERAALGPWLDRVPALAPVPVADAAAVARGKALYDSPQVGCSGCHGGPLLTSNVKSAVGTAGVFKAPSLVGVAARAPFLHDGCAETLRDRFGPCGGGDQHGVTSTLSAAQLDDLLAYLESL
jgi:mono/diheme cytochrome c family protein